VTIDQRISLFGSLNMDPRSFRLNFEITLAIYDHEFTVDLRRLQQAYLDQSELLDFQRFSQRPFAIRFVEQTARLTGPLL
jgi:cardiolipin synthase